MLTDADLDAIEQRLERLTSRQSLPYAYQQLTADLRALLEHARRSPRPDPVPVPALCIEEEE